MTATRLPVCTLGTTGVIRARMFGAPSTAAMNAAVREISRTS